MNGPRLEPVEGLLAVVDDGSATGTNKFGLLLALIDLAPTVDASGELELRRIAAKLLEIHWDHARPYRGAALRQVTSGNRKNTTVVLVVERLYAAVGADLPFEQAVPRLSSPVWDAAVRDVAAATAKNPLRLLQQLPGGTPPFLYEIRPEPPRRIRFLPGALETLVRFGPVLRDLVEFRFARFVAIANRAALGTPLADELAEHLFGAARHMPPVAFRRDLWELQDRRCVYTGTPIADPTLPHSQSSLDHVIAWARVRLSTAENFVVTSVATNSAKQHFVLAPPLLHRWANHLRARGERISATAASYGWPTDSTRVVDVAKAMYQRASPFSAAWAATGGVSVLGDGGRLEAIAILAGLSEAMTTND